ncbi:MAG: OB-fold nucleic acid binding domain-containing protein [Nanoarchaeota archaeon]
MLPQEKTLLKISLVVSIIGIFILYLISSKMSLNTINISEINEDLIDKEVKVRGMIKQYQDGPSVKILKVEDDSGFIKVVVFKNKDKNTDLKTKTNIEITGKIKKYKSELEIIAKTIRIL